jgi:hypothetical protein
MTKVIQTFDVGQWNIVYAHWDSINQRYNYTNNGHGTRSYELAYAAHGGSPPLATAISERDEYQLVNLAANKLFGKIGESDMNILVSVAEFHKTVKTLNGLYRDIRRLFSKTYNLKRLLASGAISTAKAADLWLTYRFGLRPLFYEVQGTIESFARLGKPMRTRISSSVADADVYSDTLVTPSSELQGAVDYDIVRYATRDTDVSAGAILSSTIACQGVPEVLGAHNIFEAAWELVPYSFLIDYVLSTQDWVKSLQPRVQTKVLATWAVVRNRRFDSVYCDNSRVPPEREDFDLAEVNVQGFLCTKDSYTVTRYADIRRPALPSLNVRLDVPKLLDIATIAYRLRGESTLALIKRLRV